MKIIGSAWIWLLLGLQSVPSVSIVPPGRGVTAACHPGCCCCEGVKAALLGAAMEQADFSLHISPPREDPLESKRARLSTRRSKCRFADSHLPGNRCDLEGKVQ